MQIEKKRILLISGVFIILILIVYIRNFNNNNNNNYEKISFNDVINETNIKTSNSENTIEDEKIKVHIIGEVNNPGLIELNVGGRIYDAIELAGGITNNADISKTNLAYILSDGEKIYIPSVNDEDLTDSSISLNSNSKININTASVSELQNIPRCW